MCVEIGILARQELDVEEMTYHTFLQLREEWRILMFQYRYTLESI